MRPTDYFKFLVEQIHQTIVATLDEQGRPVTCAVDMMDWDEQGVYFLTAKGKALYRRLTAQRTLSLTGLRGTDTLHCVSLSVQGRVRETGPQALPRLLEKNPYMAQIYPTEVSRQALTVFCLYQGTGEWFDLSARPIERAQFSFGGAEEKTEGYRVTERCTGCGACQTVCPQACIDLSCRPAKILQAHCLRCGNCMSVCPAGAVEREGQA